MHLKFFVFMSFYNYGSYKNRTKNSPGSFYPDFLLCFYSICFSIAFSLSFSKHTHNFFLNYLRINYIHGAPSSLNTSGLVFLVLFLFLFFFNKALRNSLVAQCVRDPALL